MMTTAATHTPGPWEAMHTTGAGWSVRKEHERPGYTGKAPVCTLAWWQFDIPGIIDDEISAANAKLIAAAPELLDALQDIVQLAAETKMMLPPDLADSIRVFARAAIAKATT